MHPTERPDASGFPKKFSPANADESDDSAPIEFRPLTEGLGFHLFADGLPYAPRGANPNPPFAPGNAIGTGAVAAGKPVFAFPPTGMPAAPKTTTDITADRIRRELETIRAQLQQPQSTFPGGRPEPRPAIAAPATASAGQLSRKLAQLDAHGFGYVLSRSFAYLIDFAFVGSICGSILSVALLNLGPQDVGYISLEATITAGAFLFVCIWAAIAAQEVAFGTSLGKRIFNLRLRGTGTDVFVRAVFFLPSLLFSGLGLLMCIADSRKRCWHDRVSQLQPEFG